MLNAITIWKNLSETARSKCLQRAVRSQDAKFLQTVKKIVEEVRAGGDAALRSMTQQYDGVDIQDFQVSPQEFGQAHHQVDKSTRQAIERAIRHIQVFHQVQKPQNIRVETTSGVLCESQARPIERVGLYIPGGSAPLVSTVLMLGVPAKIAECPTRILCSPPRKENTIDPHILVAAELCGIEKVYKIGGAQAIAAMAYGTETILKVDKIFGPGNSWVTQAKILVAQDVEGALYDLPAGPSEVLVIADDSANSEFVAADLLSQAEHGADSQVILVATSRRVAEHVIQAIEQQLLNLSRREIAITSLKNSALILVDTIDEAISISNRYAPEHLILQIENPRRHLTKIQSAGSVFLGPWSPESVGDYASGTNHVLPTYGFAKSLSGLSVRDFMKSMTVQELTRDGLASIADTVRALTRIEGLDAHQRAIDIRLAMGETRGE